MYYSEITYRVNDQGMIVEEIDESDNQESPIVNPHFSPEYDVFDNVIERAQTVNK